MFEVLIFVIAHHHEVSFEPALLSVIELTLLKSSLMLSCKLLFTGAVFVVVPSVCKVLPLLRAGWVFSYFFSIARAKVYGSGVKASFSM